MKLLGWMHRKFRQNSGETFKDFAIGHSSTCPSGQPSLDEQHHYTTRPHYGTSPFRQAPREHLQKSFTGLETATVEEDYEGVESSAAASELFHGFLAIGTLGSDPAVIDPSTPTFSISIENITGKETEATENELKLINEELEKVLGAEAKENNCSDASRRNSHVSTGRNSHVSTGRSSHGSTITLSGKPNEGLEIDGNGTSVCPLQGYLFGSAIELSETKKEAKKEHRASLGELFQKSKIGENSVVKSERDEKRADREAEKSAVQLMKKMLKKKVSNASSKGSTASADSASAEKKQHKILQMFHRKVHPESSSTMQKLDTPQKIEKKMNISYDGAHKNESQILQDDDIVIFPQKGLLKEGIRRYNSQFNPPHFAPSSGDSHGNTEHWIKTDADYLVLEL